MQYPSISALYKSQWPFRALIDEMPDDMVRPFYTAMMTLVNGVIPIRVFVTQLSVLSQPHAGSDAVREFRSVIKKPESMRHITALVDPHTETTVEAVAHFFHEVLDQYRVYLFIAVANQHYTASGSVCPPGESTTGMGLRLKN